MMLASTIEMDPKVRIQGLLETTNRYLERARAAEASNAFLRGLTIHMKGFIEDVRAYVGKMEFAPDSYQLLQLIDLALAELDYVPSQPAGAPAEEEAGGC